MSIHKWTFDVPRVPWHEHNDYFHYSDKHVSRFVDFKIPAGWWSRGWEYPWAYAFIKPGQTVVDMGCGYTFRPFSHALAKIAEEVWAIDTNSAMLKLNTPDNVIRVVTDFTKKTPTIQDDSFDVVFCISVLEDTDNILGALQEFKRVVKPNGLIVLTFDVPYDPKKPEHELYKGVDLRQFKRAVRKAGLKFNGPVNENLDDRLCNEEFNLSVYHAVLRK